mgnify:CR=1 FL=1
MIFDALFAQWIDRPLGVGDREVGSAIVVRFSNFALFARFAL